MMIYRRFVAEVYGAVWCLQFCWLSVVLCPSMGFCDAEQVEIANEVCLDQSFEGKQVQEAPALMASRITQELQNWLADPLCQASPQVAYCQLLQRESERLAKTSYSIENYYDWIQLESQLAILAQASKKANWQERDTLLTAGQTIWLTHYPTIREVQLIRAAQADGLVGRDEEDLSKLKFASVEQMEQLDVIGNEATFFARCQRTLTQLFAEQELIFVAEHHQEQEVDWLKTCIIAYGQQTPLLYMQENLDESAGPTTWPSLLLLQDGKVAPSFEIGLEDSLLSPFTSLFAAADVGEEGLEYLKFGGRINREHLEAGKQRIVGLWLLALYTSQLRETLLLALQQQNPELTELLREMLAQPMATSERKHIQIQDHFERLLEQVWFARDRPIHIDLPALHKLTKLLLKAHLPYLDDPIALVAVQACLEEHQCREHTFSVALYARTATWLRTIHRFRDQFPNHRVIIHAGALHIPLLEQVLGSGICPRRRWDFFSAMGAG